MEIALTKGKFAIIDDDDFDLVSKYKWQVNEFRNGQFRATARESRKKGHACIYMHRLIMNVKDRNIHVDHIDGNMLNNTRNNLRICTNQQNRFNSKTYKTNTTGYKGVYQNKTNNRFYAYINAGGKRLNLGGYSNAEDAYKAYCAAAKCIHGEFART